MARNWDGALRARVLSAAVFNYSGEQNCGGYDCEFVEPPPSVFQTECPVCLLVLKEPCLISCCGHKFCRKCIERIKDSEVPCPLCSQPNFTFLRERALERSLNDWKVWCTYRKKGCKWKGRLRKLEKHLNQDLSQENRLNGCQFVAVECTYKCGKWFYRCHITTHETQQCKKRPYSCAHCRDYHSTFEDVTEVHYPQCGKYPVACPNCCDVYMIERQNVESHLREQCRLTVVECPFHFAGCETRLPRKDMPEHARDIKHLTLLATATKELSTENQRLVKENQELQQNMKELLDKQQRMEIEVHQRLVKENQELRQNMKELLQKQQRMEIDVQQHIHHKNQQLVKENQELQQNMKELLHKQQSMENEVQQHVHHSGFPIDFHMKLINETVYSPAFYTHPHGYRMCVGVSPNRCGDGKETIFTHMMQGPFDDYLKWPFRGEITIQIVNQVGDHRHTEWIYMYCNDKTSDNMYTAGKETGKVESDKERGNPQIFAHNRLQYNAERDTHYLLHIRVMKVTLIS